MTRRAAGEHPARIAQAVDHHVDRVLQVLLQARRGIEVVHRAVDAHPRKALRAQLFEKVRLLALASGNHRGEHHQATVLRQLRQLVDHLRHRLRLERKAMVRAIGRAGARVEQAQVVVDLGHGADGRARVVARALLLDGDRRRKSLDQVDVRLRHQLEELARVGRQALHVAPLAFGVQRVERERALARAGEAGNHHQAIARQLDIQVLEIVGARAAHPD